jgi:phage shock protein PspC (stress-responsive transcriptional regulator)
MTDTHGPSSTDEQQSTGPDAYAGVDRQHLRNYEELRRSTSDRKIAGVAGGLGRHLNIDPTIVRVLLVVLCFFGGAGFVLYGAAWLLVPEDGQVTGKVAVRPNTRNALLIGAGVLAALLLVGDSWNGIGFPWPLLLVGVGVLVYLAVRDNSSPTAPGTAPSPSYGQVPGSAYAPSSGQQPPVPPWAPQPVPAPQPQRPTKRGPRLFGITLAFVAVALGVLGLVDAATGGGEVTAAAYPALALAVVGLMLVVGAFVGRAGGLILLGILAAVALAVTSVVSSVDGFDGGEGKQLNATPTSASAVEDSYFVPSGRVVLDLSEVKDPAALDGRSIDVGARAGELVVILPEGVRTDVTADISGPGEIDLPNQSTGGFDNSLQDTYGSGSRSVALHTHLFAGHIDVRNPR